MYSVGSLLGLIADAKMLVNGVPGKPRMPLVEGDTVSVEFPEQGLRLIEPRKMDLDVLYEDASCIVINKPPGLAVVPEREAVAYPLMSGLLHHLKCDSPYATGELLRPMIVHRLDKDTSGALVIAKSLDAMRSLTRQFESRTVHKEYLAVVRGIPPQEFEIDLPITAKGVKGGRAIVSERKGRPALTVVCTEEYFRGFALVRATPKTGRMHQVRLHLKATGYPVVADPLYSAGRLAEPALYLSQLKAGYRPKPGRRETPLIARQALHAHRLGFEVPQHPDGPVKEVLAEAALPNDMEVVLKMLRKYRTPDS